MPDLEYCRNIMNLGDRRGAEKELTRILRSDPGIIEAWLLLAKVIDDPEKKADCYRQVIKLDPVNTDAPKELQRVISSAQDAMQKVTQPPSATIINYDAAKQKRESSQKPEHKPALFSNKASSIENKIGLSKKEWRLLIGVFLLILMFITFISGYALFKIIENDMEATQTAIAIAATTSSHLNCRLQFEGEMTEIFSRFFRQLSIAEVTARINVPEQIARMEDIRNEAWVMENKTCNPELHAHLLDYMDKSINSMIAFSADSVYWTDRYVDSLRALVALDDAIIANGHPGGLVELFRERGYYYWELLDDPNWKSGING